jgi:hypothetical protein
MAAYYLPQIKRRLPIAALVILSLLLSSCYGVTSVYPLSEGSDDKVFYPELVDVWEEEPNYAVVQKAADSLYRIMLVTQTDDSPPQKDTSCFIGQLVKVDDYLFLDCQANMQSPAFEHAGKFTCMSLRPTHFFCRLQFRNHNEVLEMWELNASGLDTILQEKGIHYYAADIDYLCLLEPSAGLKKLLVQLLEQHPEVWVKRTLMRRDSSNIPLPHKPA